MSDQLEFKISEGLIKPIIEAKINAAVIEAFGGADKLLSGVMQQFMGQKVDTEGKVSTYSHSGDKTRIDYLMTKMLEEALKAALSEFLKNKKDFIEAEFMKYFKTKKGTTQIIEAITDGFCDALQDKWTCKIEFKLPERS